MKITDVTVRRVDVPHPHPYRHQWSPPNFLERSREASIIKISTDTGLVGWGITHMDHDAAIRAVVAPALRGQDPRALGRHIQVIRATQAFVVDTALCDLVGKAAGAPLHHLWGFNETRIRAYASTVVASTPEQRAEDAIRYLEQGFTAIKLRTAFPTMAEDIALVAAVRAAVGDRMEIMVDANLAGGIGHIGREIWSFDRALATARELEQLGVVWLEEPLARDDIQSIARLTAETEIAIAGGEGDVGYETFVALLHAGAYDILQLDATICEGLSQFIGIAGAADFAGRQVIPHHGGTGVGIAAHLQFGVCVPNCPYMEFILDSPYRTVEHYQQLGGIVADPVWIDAEGFVDVPTGPGLGMEVNEEAIEEYEVNV